MKQVLLGTAPLRSALREASRAQASVHNRLKWQMYMAKQKGSYKCAGNPKVSDHFMRKRFGLRPAGPASRDGLVLAEQERGLRTPFSPHTGMAGAGCASSPTLAALSALAPAMPTCIPRLR